MKMGAISLEPQTCGDDRSGKGRGHSRCVATGLRRIPITWSGDSETALSFGTRDSIDLAPLIRISRRARLVAYESSAVRQGHKRLQGSLSPLSTHISRRFIRVFDPIIFAIGTILRSTVAPKQHPAG